MMKDAFLAVAIAAARSAGKVHKKYYRREIKIATKSSPFDLVTVADIEAEKAVVRYIKKSFPAHNILAEEARYQQSESEYTWIVDPLDGTSNFAYKIPMFCVSIALAKKDTLILGVIYDALRDELFVSRKGQGAFLNGKRINVAKSAKLEGSLLITGFYYDRGPKMLENLDKIRLFLQSNIVGIRRFGSAALDLCYVACGRASGFWEYELNPWDFAAGKLMVEEAGGKTSQRYGEPLGLKNSYVVASNGRIHKQMLDVLKT